MTNRELYQFVRQLRNKFEPQKSLSLEQYLSSLWAIVSVQQDTQLTIEKLVEWLDTALGRRRRLSTPIGWMVK